MAQPFGSNDAILFVSLLYSCADLWSEWEQFAQCRRPIHKWLLVSYACVIAFRLAHLLGTKTAASMTPSTNAAADFLLDLRQKGLMPKMFAGFTWFLALPFFVVWTVLGTSWLYDVVSETPQCVPSATHLWFSGFWLALCYIWILVHAALGTVAWLLECRVRRAEVDLRALEDADVISRWGQVSQLSGYTSLTNNSELGLTPAEIRALPGTSTFGDETHDFLEDCECPICITSFKTGDGLRTLPSCGHVFHRSCIDLWLLRRADCPLCKRSARNEGA